MVISFAACRPYLPSLVTEWRRESPETLWRRREGSMVFVDVSGFTSMSERLARRGRVGAEEVTAVISETFDGLLDEAHGFGGSLLKFGGDALLLWFTGPDHALRAASAALGMRARLRVQGRFSTSAGKVTLRMSVGADSGVFSFFLVGSSHRELIVAGPSTSRVVEMEEGAGTGQILVGGTMASALPSENMGRSKGPGTLLKGDPPYPRSSTPAEASPDGMDDVDLTVHIPRALRPVVLAAEQFAEHRRVTVAFLRFTGVDPLLEASGPDATAEQLDELVTRVQAGVDRHGVCFLASDVARDGGKIILTAGAPDATGDDEERMLLALHEIRAEGLDLGLHVGVNRGHVFAGEVGPTSRRTYTVMGDTVNLAARFMTKAGDDEIVAGGEVLAASRAQFATETLDPFHVKGKRHAVHGFVVGGPVTGRIGDRDGRIPLIGRDAELARLTSAWDRAIGGDGQVVEISAEPGMGKSRLVDEFLDAAGAPQVIRVEGSIQQNATPYHAVSEVMRQALALLDSSVDRLAETVALRAPDLQPWLSLLAVPLGLDIEPSPQVRMLDDEYRRPRIAETVDRFLDAILAGPLAIVVEDVHWVDSASLEILRRLASGLDRRRWLLCVTTRPGSDPLSDAAGTRLELRPLDDDAAVALLLAASGGQGLLPQQARALAEQARGNPLFLIELVRALHGGQDADELPGSIEGLIQARIDRLPPPERSALRRLAVLGPSFDLDHAPVVLDDEDHAPSVQDAMRRLAGFLILDEESAVASFEHALTRDVAYAALPYSTRRRLHGRVAESIRTEQQGSSERDPLLSFHYFHAGEWGPAWDYSRLAGDGARSGYANVEAATLYERALRAARRLEDVEPAELAAVNESLGDARHWSGSWPEAGKAYRVARGLTHDPLSEARLRLKEARVEEKRGRYSQALRWLTLGLRAIAALRGPEADSMRAQLSVWRSAIRVVQGKLDRAIEWAERAMAEADESGDLDALAHALYLHDAANVFLGRTVDESKSRRALQIYEELGDLSGQAVVANNLAGYAYFDGRWDEAVDWYERSRRANLQSGDPVEAVRASAGIGEIRCDQGDLDRARAALEEALPVWRAAGYPSEIAFVLSQLGRVASREGRFDEAQRLYEEARHLYADRRSYLLETDTRIAENLVYRGRADQAIDRLERVEEDAARLGGEPVQLLRVRLLRGYAATQRGHLEMARHELAASLAVSREKAASYDTALALEALSRLARLEGREDWRDGLPECWEILDGLGVVSVPVVPLRSRESGS